MRPGLTVLVALPLLILALAIAAGNTGNPGAPAASSASPAASAVATPEATAASPGASAAASPAGSASALLATLPVKGKAAKTGYDRTGEFGSAWRDVDRNGCDTRNDILARDLTVIVTSGPCKVMSGQLLAPYTGRTVAFVRGETTSTLVQIDHLVALSNAWQTGAQQLTQDQRIALANDPVNLLASDGASNSQKSDGDAATWLPAASSFRCEYVARQISVKAAYGLWVAPAEHDAMARVLAACPDQQAYADTPAPAF
ncbi:HNH endonuclease [Cryobacterium sp. TMT1-21]|uniref:HNH endonuclease n=1 Tax=Cryobacterium shii TaxID=1259235 RepID=A0AAQ2HHD3_9MICO|nr:HNH endonuclease [Cryobacterium shii]TFC82107.1 HNH endonuclease [Cryobacterium sp. TmT2-59]TFD18062.1 HNH endonuclease [Cryobacterium sp. TMT1-21]TFD19702.1 HNH endonuclease [Cryobacterium sp. TMT4-10]TFD25080.1 HNH endonuclease [Cryobacterium sp. TMT2-23]TFD40870.1 HNH endonuclease [Cryobacterium sp. TMT2-10]